MTVLLLLSATGTLRIILILGGLGGLGAFPPARQGRPPGTHWAPRDERPRGDVRVERADDRHGARPGGGRIEDADYEEIR